MNNVQYGNSTYKSLQTLGDVVLLEVLSGADLRQINGIYIPESQKFQNSKIGCGKILELSREIEEKYAIYKNDLVLYDYYSAFNENKNTVLIRAENLILKLSEDEVQKFLSESL